MTSVEHRRLPDGTPLTLQPVRGNTAVRPFVAARAPSLWPWRGPLSPDHPALQP